MSSVPLTPEQQAAAAEIDGTTAPRREISGEVITQEEDNAVYRVILLPIVQTLAAVLCPNWGLTPDEHSQIVESFIPLIQKYIPNLSEGAQIPPEVLALLTLAMIAAPRLAANKPMRVVVEEEPTKEAA